MKGQKFVVDKNVFIRIHHGWRRRKYLHFSLSRSLKNASLTQFYNFTPPTPFERSFCYVWIDLWVQVAMSLYLFKKSRSKQVLESNTRMHKEEFSSGGILWRKNIYGRIRECTRVYGRNVCGWVFLVRILRREISCGGV